MVNSKEMIFSVILLLPAAAAATSRCSDPTEFDPSFCLFEMPEIARIEIKKNATKSSLEDDKSVDCSQFVLTDRLVRQYFAKAKFVSPKTRYHELDWSACYASGTMLLKDGRRLDWTIMQVNVAYLFEEGQPERRFVCKACTDEPFAFKQRKPPEGGLR